MLFLKCHINKLSGMDFDLRIKGYLVNFRKIEGIWNFELLY